MINIIVTVASRDSGDVPVLSRLNICRKHLNKGKYCYIIFLVEEIQLKAVMKLCFVDGSPQPPLHMERGDCLGKKIFQILIFTIIF